MKIMVGMSGGVDSSAAAALLCAQNEVEGVTLSLLGCSSADTADAKAVCDRLNIPHRSIDLSQDFKQKVIENFISEYCLCRTPNPCIQCNRHIKFGKMLDIALLEGFDAIATGHYARIERAGNKYLLKKAVDTKKDQSYVLYVLNQKQLAHTLFPLGEYSKAEIREIAESRGLITAHKSDSQDICFVENGKYAEFIKAQTKREFPEGDYVDTKGLALGKHKGIINYTIGQRKGLGIALGHPAFVISKDLQSNSVVLGAESELYSNRVLISDINLTAGEALQGIKAKAKLRYSQTEEPCRVHEVDTNTLMLEFERPQRAASAGQSAVIYDGDIVLGGGIIEKGEK